MKTEHQSCEYFAELISARMDDELELDSVSELNDHLASCEPCQARESRFQEIDELILASAEGDAGEVPIASLRGEYEQAQAVSGRTGKSRSRSVFRWVPLAVPASVFIGLLMANFPGPQNKVTAEQIAKPLFELELINSQHRDNQVRMLKTIELDLRALRLELAQLQEQGQSPEKLRLEENLNRLIARVIELSREPIEYRNLPFDDGRKTNEVEPNLN